MFVERCACLKPRGVRGVACFLCCRRYWEGQVARGRSGGSNEERGKDDTICVCVTLDQAISAA